MVLKGGKMIFKIIKSDMMLFKFRTVAILISMALSVAFFYASLTTFNVVLESYKDGSKIIGGNSDFIITSKELASNASFTVMDLSEELNKQIQYEIDSPNAIGVYNSESSNEQLLIHGLQVDEIAQMEVFQLHSENNISEFTGNKVCLNSEFALKYGYSRGDLITIEIFGKEYNFKVYGILEPKSMFNAKACENQIIIPKTTLKKIMNLDSKATNNVYVKCKTVNRSMIQEKLMEVYSGQSVKDTFSRDKFNDKIEGIKIIFIICTIVIFIMCLMIVYNVFKVIFNRRFKMLGILRSVGATKSHINKLVFSEAIVYGFTGGILGGIIGILITYLMAQYLKPESISKITFHVDVLNLTGSVLLSIVICIYVSFIAGKAVIKKPIKELILNIKEEKKQKKHNIRMVIGLFIFILNIGFLFFIPKDSAMDCLVISILVSLITVLCFLREVIMIAMHLIEKASSGVAKNIGYLAIQSLKADQNIKRCILLIVISVGTILMTHSALNSIVSSNMDTIALNYNCQYIITTSQEADEMVDEVTGIDGVDSCYRQRYVENVAVYNSADYKIYNIDGYEDSQYLEYRNFNIKQSLFKSQDKRWIVLTNTIRTKLNLALNDKIKLLDMNGVPQNYTIVGFFDTTLNNGSYALIPQNYLIKDFAATSSSEIYVKTDEDMKAIKTKLEERLKKYAPTIQTVQEMVNQLFESSKITFNAIKIISILPIIVSIIILCGNSIINFYENKRSMAIFRALGVDKTGARKLILIEYTIGGTIASCLGVLFGNMLVFQIKKFLNVTGSTMPVQYSISLSIMIFVVVIVLYLLPAIFLSVKGLDFSIAGEIKNRE